MSDPDTVQRVNYDVENLVPLLSLLDPSALYVFGLALFYSSPARLQLQNIDLIMAPV
jgi:hypothetical protein